MVWKKEKRIRSIRFWLGEMGSILNKAFKEGRNEIVTFEQRCEEVGIKASQRPSWTYQLPLGTRSMCSAMFQDCYKWGLLHSFCYAPQRRGASNAVLLSLAHHHMLGVWWGGGRSTDINGLKNLSFSKQISG